MEEMNSKIGSGPVVVTFASLPQSEGAPSDEYIARRKAAGAGLPILEVPVPEWNDKQGHEEG